MTGSLRVLLVEDSETDCKLIVRALRKSWRLEARRIETADALRAALTGETWDVVISDWALPTFSAPDALRIVKEMALDVPFIIVSGTIGEEIAVEAVRAGARDYVLKDKLVRLGAVVERELREHAERAARRAAEEALRASQARFARLAESGIVGIVIGKIDGTIEEANETFLDMTGYSAADLAAGKLPFRGMTHPDWASVDEAAISRLEAQGVAKPYEKELIDSKGRRIPVLFGAAALSYPRCIAFVADLTERKETEEALRRSQDQLRQAQKMEAIGRLAGGIAHDFNNLLSIIVSYAELVSDQITPGDPVRADLDEIGTAGRRAAELTRQLLAFSRKQILAPRVVALNEIVEGVEKMLRRVLGEDVELVTHLAPDVDSINVDPGQMEQVLMNLAVNARDAMPKGGCLTIETSNVQLDQAFAATQLGVSAGPHVMLVVSDTGSGMSDEVKSKIFEPFFTTKEVGKGTGLGLSTVLGIVQQSGGGVWVESDPGMGTLFQLFFPRAEGAAPAERSPSSPPPPSRGTETILIVDDDERLRVLLRRVLAQGGYEVLVAEGAGDAVLLCEDTSRRVDLLLTDVVMPRMSGPDLAARLAPARPRMRILYMSGYMSDAAADQVQASGMPFLQKPITPSSLLSKVRQVLDAAE